MTKATWPFPDRPGVPLNPKKPGIHWLLNPDNDPIVTFWACDAWELREGATTARKVAQDGWRYLGPCLTPEEIAAKDARIAKLERLLGLADSWISAAIECKEWRWDADQHEAAYHTRDEIRAALGEKDG